MRTSFADNCRKYLLISNNNRNNNLQYANKSWDDKFMTGSSTITISFNSQSKSDSGSFRRLRRSDVFSCIFHALFTESGRARNLKERGEMKGKGRNRGNEDFNYSKKKINMGG